MNSKGKIKKITASVLVMVLLFAFSGCGGSEDAGSDAEPGTVIAQNDEEITIIDQAGREVTVKRDIRATKSRESGNQSRSLRNCSRHLLTA